jgi:NhaP-type Na+/H+ or K+/H+ antiporter
MNLKALSNDVTSRLTFMGACNMKTSGVSEHSSRCLLLSVCAMIMSTGGVAIVMAAWGMHRRFFAYRAGYGFERL